MLVVFAGNAQQAVISARVSGLLTTNSIELYAASLNCPRTKVWAWDIPLAVRPQSVRLASVSLVC